jgi:hypothetical protein
MSGARSLHDIHRAMIVAVVAVLVVQVALDQVIDVVPMRDSLVAAAGAVLVPAVMLSAGVAGGAAGRVGGVDWQLVLLDSSRADMVQVAVVQEIDMIVVLDGRVSTVRAMLMIVIGVVSHVLAPLRVLVGVQPFLHRQPSLPSASDPVIAAPRLRPTQFPLRSDATSSATHFGLRKSRL